MEIAETSNPSATGSEKGSKNCGQAKKELATPAKQLFRPINFENGSPTPATPEGIDSNGSKVTLGNDSESGSENALDSAYSSDNPQPQNGKSAGKMVATLQNKTLWKDFRKIGNEMIVTKPGRRLFPALLVSLHGLDLDMEYSISLKVTTADNQRYRYMNTKWSATGESEVIQNEERQIFRHPSSPSTGRFWMKRPISFKSIKITHYAKSPHGNILLHTMHKYIMKIVIDPVDGSGPTIIPLPDSTFIAVSAYQNMEITQLKIDKNPFAKGFRYKVRVSDRGSSSSSGRNSGNGTPNNTKASKFVVLNSMASTMPPPPLPIPRESHMLTYWQQLQMQGLVPQYNPVLTMASPPSLPTSASSNESSKEPSPIDQPSGRLAQVPMASHYPLFYHHPFLPAPPPYIVPTTMASEPRESKEAIAKVEEK